MIEYTVRVYNDRTEWFLNDELHREDGPACEYSIGDKLWYLNDKLHREDGPACELSNGDKIWYLNGKRHREDGPAIENSNGSKYWYLNNKVLTEKEFLEEIQPTKELSINELQKLLGYKIKVIE
jgi:hypothetical protein